MQSNSQKPPSPSPDGQKRPRAPRTALALIAFSLIIFLLITVFGGEVEDSREPKKKTPAEFFYDLYSGDIAELEIVGRQEAVWQSTRDVLAEQPKSYRAQFPDYQLEQYSQDINRFTRWTPEWLSQGDLLAQIDDGTLTPTAAWTLTRDNETSLFVDAYRRDPSHQKHRYRIEAAFERVDIPRVIGILATKDVPLEEFRVPDPKKLTYREPNTFWKNFLGQALFWILIFGLFWFFLFRQVRSAGGAGGILSFGKAKPALMSKDRALATFADVAGIEEAKEEVKEVVEFLRNPTKFSRLGGRIPRGVLLVGPPGTGKTLLAKAIAGEAKVPFFSISGSDFVEMFVGVGASRVRDLFRQARENSPCLIFLDEIDAVGRKRGTGLGGGHDEREQTLNAILVEMDGFQTDEGIILMAATNRSDVLDPALLRPGRFDRQIMIHLPDLQGRLSILRVHTKKVTLSPGVDLEIVARGTPGFSGAELAALVNEAALIATLKDKDGVELEDLEEARDKVRWGRQKASQVMDEEDKLITAYHEAGHALIALLHDDVEPLHKVTIIPRGMSLGATMVLPERDRYHQRRKQLLGYIAFAFGGRIAEEIFCNDISAGAQDDIRRASEIARMMVCQWGMSEVVGPISYSEEGENVFLGQELVRNRNHSEETSMLIDKEVSRIIDECYRAARTMIEENSEKLESITLALMRFETLSGRQVQAVTAGVPIEELEKIAPQPASSTSDSTDDESSSEAKESPKNSAAGDLPHGDLPPAGEPAY